MEDDATIHEFKQEELRETQKLVNPPAAAMKYPRVRHTAIVGIF